jgi:menaquinone-dependent protoporphyrinogen oxidase
MSSHILVAYASRAGSTAEVAETVGQVLREGGAQVDVRSVDHVKILDGYDAVVLGTAIWAFKPLPEAQRFAAEQRRALANLPVAYFALCEILRNDTPANRARARRFLDPLRQIEEPVSFEVFAGKRDLSRVNPVLRWLLKTILKIEHGDWRNWDEIRAWAAALTPCLTQPESAPAGRS